MIPADGDELVTAYDIAEKYKASEGAVAYWTTLPGFPEAWPSGPGRTLVRKAAEVDEWMKENLPVHWAKGQDSANPFGLPAGKPTDLVTLADICVWEGKALGRKGPVPEATLRSYLSKKPPKMPGPDRVPGDGKHPEVTTRRWFRKTAYDFVHRPRRMRRQAKPQEAEVSKQPSAVASTPRNGPSTARKVLDVQAIATTYRISGQTAKAWTRADGFPPAKGGTYSAAEVDVWVRENRKRSWTAAQRSAEAADRASVSPAPDVSTAEPAPEGGWKDALTPKTIALRYGVSEAAARHWTTIKDKRDGRKVVRRAFPASLSDRSLVYAPKDVDAWVRDNRPHVWATYTGTGPTLVSPLPEGDPLDLLDIYDFAEVLGMATRGEPLARETIHAYHARGQIPYADRTAGDGKKPEVFSDHWFRQTVYEVVLSRSRRDGT